MWFGQKWSGNYDGEWFGDLGGAPSPGGPTSGIRKLLYYILRRLR